MRLSHIDSAPQRRRPEIESAVRSRPILPRRLVGYGARRNVGRSCRAESIPVRTRGNGYSSPALLAMSVGRRCLQRGHGATSNQCWRRRREGAKHVRSRRSAQQSWPVCADGLAAVQEGNIAGDVVDQAAIWWIGNLHVNTADAPLCASPALRQWPVFDARFLTVSLLVVLIQCVADCPEELVYPMVGII